MLRCTGCSTEVAPPTKSCNEQRANRRDFSHTKYITICVISLLLFASPHFCCSLFSFFSGIISFVRSSGYHKYHTRDVCRNQHRCERRTLNAARRISTIKWNTNDENELMVLKCCIQFLATDSDTCNTFFCCCRLVSVVFFSIFVFLECCGFTKFNEGDYTFMVTRWFRDRMIFFCFQVAFLALFSWPTA